MDWLNQLGGLLQQYKPGQQSQSAEDDFDTVARAAPREEVAEGLAESFRSGDTPPFPQMLGQLFGSSTGTQRASILNTILAGAGPGLLSGVLGGIGLRPGQNQVTAEQAEQISPELVQKAAAEAESHDPSIIERVSQFYADQPQLIKTLGGVALTVAIAQIARKHRIL